MFFEYDIVLRYLFRYITIYGITWLGLLRGGFKTLIKSRDFLDVDIWLCISWADNDFHVQNLMTRLCCLLFHKRQRTHIIEP
jgi:hypothetical protein